MHGLELLTSMKPISTTCISNELHVSTHCAKYVTGGINALSMIRGERESVHGTIHMCHAGSRLGPFWTAGMQVWDCESSKCLAGSHPIDEYHVCICPV